MIEGVEINSTRRVMCQSRENCPNKKEETPYGKVHMIDKWDVRGYYDDYTVRGNRQRKYYCGDCTRRMLEHQMDVARLFINEYFGGDKADYKKGFQILMEYFDSIADEEKPKIDERLKACGL